MHSDKFVYEYQGYVCKKVFSKYLGKQTFWRATMVVCGKFINN